MDSAKLERASRRARDFLLARLQPDGSYAFEAGDVAAYYKSPTFFLRSGRPAEANLVLNHIKRRFQTVEGGFGLTTDPALSQYGSYIPGWIAMGAHRAGRFDLAYPASSYLDSFHRGGRFSTLRPGDEQSDILTVAHLGLHALYTGQQDRARAAGEDLIWALSEQLESGKFLLRWTAGGPVRDFPPEAAFLFMVDSAQPQQAFFMLGYPLAFLCLLHRATSEESYLKAARNYFDFTFGCEGIESFHFSHKVAWGSALLAAATGEERARGLCEQIVEHLLSIQAEDGGWHQDQPPVFRLDQTAEIGLWLLEISSEG